MIGKNITPGHEYNRRNVTLLFDTDGNQTVDAALDIQRLEMAKAIPFYNLTNGTTKSVYEWKKMVPPYNSTYSR